MVDHWNSYPGKKSLKKNGKGIYFSAPPGKNFEAKCENIKTNEVMFCLAIRKSLYASSLLIDSNPSSTSTPRLLLKKHLNLCKSPKQ